MPMSLIRRILIRRTSVIFSRAARAAFGNASVNPATAGNVLKKSRLSIAVLPSDETTRTREHPEVRAVDRPRRSYATVSSERVQGVVSRHGKCYRRKGRRAVKGVTEAGVPQEGTRVGPQARHEYLAQMRDRYLRAARREKGRMLTEAVTVTGYHRKAIIRAWQRPAPRGARGAAAGPADAL